jgi:hypothetical protein
VVQPGEQVALSWSVQDAKAVYLSTAVQSWQNSPVEATASRYMYPQRSTTYELHIVNGDDTVESIRVRVEVENFDPPRITLFDVDPRRPTEGECLDIFWETANRVSRVIIYLNSEILYDGKDNAGVLRTCPATGLGEVVYRIVARGPGGEDTAEQRVVIP